MPTDVPYTRIDWRENRNFVQVFGFRPGTQEQVAIEMSLEEWLELGAVKYAVELAFDDEATARAIMFHESLHPGD